MYENKKGAILNSRQQLRPSLSDDWVIKTIEAADWVKSNSMRLLVSCGMSSWEISLTLASSLDIPIDFYIPLKKNENFDSVVSYFKEQFDLENKDVTFFECTSRKDRDRRIINESEILIPISIRPNGSLEKLILESGIKTVCNFHSVYQKDRKSFAYQLNEDDLNPELNDIPYKYLFHWTRTTNDKWQNEKWFDYYNAVISNKLYPRSAFEALKNILNQKIIFASSKNIMGKNKVVSFSSESPPKMLPMMRWRNRYHQMSFEPYGIGFEVDSVLAKKILPVIYHKADEKIDKSNSWLYQSDGKITNWRMEKEYRHLDSFSFSDFPADKILIITRFKKEADQIKELTGLKTISFTKE